MTGHLLAIALGPVQEFISAARRTRDLWFGSYLLSEISKATAKLVNEAGGILIFAVERTNLWRRMPIDQYAVDFRRSLFRVDPMMPILGVIAGAAAIIFALQRSGAASGLAWAGIGFIALVVVASALSRFALGAWAESELHTRDLDLREFASVAILLLAMLVLGAAPGLLVDASARAVRDAGELIDPGGSDSTGR